MKRQLDIMKDEQRPWIYVKSLTMGSALEIREDYIDIVLLFELSNSGRTPAHFVTIQGDMYPTVAPKESILKDKSRCSEYRKATSFNAEGVRKASTIVFPGASVKMDPIFGMSKDNFKAWKKSSGDLGVIMIEGCVDYVFPDSDGRLVHHQTEYSYSLDKYKPGFVMPIPTVNATIPEDNLSLTEQYDMKDAD